ncbi:T9SS type A sorting domain-containing protein [Chitinophagaceae bacterium MMS25-I14]
MKKALLLFSLLALGGFAQAQITITSSVIPSAGDTFRYSSPAITTNVSLATGANMAWNFSTLAPVSQGVQSWKTVTQVNAAFGLSGIPLTAFGFKVLDSISLGGFTAQDPYSFFLKRTSPDRLSAVGFGATISGLGLPLGAPYQDEDEWFIYPLTYNHHDSTTYALTASLSGATVKMSGYRNTYVDGWGTITTPYYTTATDVLRVRSEVNEVDTIDFGGTPTAISRQSADYYWLTQNDKFPALWVNVTMVGGNAVPTFTRYRDMARHVGVASLQSPEKVKLTAYPNPSANGVFHVTIPAAWHEFSVEVYDMTGKILLAQANNASVDLSARPAGQYIIRIANADNQVGYSLIEKQ